MCASSGRLDSSQITAVCTLINCVLGYNPALKFSGRYMILSDFALMLIAYCEGILVGNNAVNGGTVLVKSSFLNQFEG
jgi:hypothetical protein